MGKKNNVNPNHYKEEGRERPGQDIVQEIHKQKFTQAQTEQRIQNSEGGSEFIPGGGDWVCGSARRHPAVSGNDGGNRGADAAECA